ncbi:uncharacterized protein [Clytia hemisphaerica]
MDNRKTTFDKCDKDACRNMQEIIFRAFTTSGYQHFMDAKFTSSTIMLPHGFTNNLIKYISDYSLLRSMEKKSAINWNPNVKPLLPVYVEDDGNSLIHSVSVYIFGLQDKAHILRQAIFQIMNMESRDGDYYTRWVNDHQQCLMALQRSSPKDYNKEFNKSWEYYLSNVKDQNPHPRTKKYASIEAIHIFILANIIGRPIIVYAGYGDQEESANAIRLEGIYLPLMRSPENCARSPVLIGYNSDNFSPLLIARNDDLNFSTFNNNSPNSNYHAPLVRSNGSNIPVRFLRDQEFANSLYMLRRYLDVITLQGSVTTTVAELSFKMPNEHTQKMMTATLEIVTRWATERGNAINQQQYLYQNQHVQHQRYSGQYAEPPLSPIAYNQQPPPSPTAYNQQPPVSPTSYNQQPSPSPTAYNQQPPASPTAYNQQNPFFNHNRQQYHPAHQMPNSHATNGPALGQSPQHGPPFHQNQTYNHHQYQPTKNAVHTGYGAPFALAPDGQQNVNYQNQYKPNQVVKTGYDGHHYLNHQNQTYPLQENGYQPPFPIHKPQPPFNNNSNEDYYDAANKYNQYHAANNGFAIAQEQKALPQKQPFKPELEYKQQQEMIARKDEQRKFLERQQNQKFQKPPRYNPEPKGQCSKCLKVYFTENGFGLCEGCFAQSKKDQQEADARLAFNPNQAKCVICNKNPIVDGSISCQECVTKQKELLQKVTGEGNADNEDNRPVKDDEDGNKDNADNDGDGDGKNDTDDDEQNDKGEDQEDDIAKDVEDLAIEDEVEEQQPVLQPTRCKYCKQPTVDDDEFCKTCLKVIKKERYEWVYEVGGVWQEFDKNDGINSELLDVHYQRYKMEGGPNYIEFSSEDGVDHMLDFEDMLVMNLDNEEEKKVERRAVPIEDKPPQPNIFEVPAHWNNVPDAGYVLIPVTDQKFNEIAAQFTQTMRQQYNSNQVGGQANGKIASIQEVCNVQTFQRYCLKKQNMKKTNGEANVNEKQIWHGTRHAIVEAICAQNFDGRMNTAYAIGKGVYFARNASMSSGYCKSVDGNGLSYMFLVDALIGYSTLGKHEYVRPPVRQGNILFDSLVDNIANPNMYVVEGDQVYPRYLIKFKK